jgi:hypothetical protein
MAKRTRRVPRYLRESETGKRPDIPSDSIPADLSQQAPNSSYSQRRFYRDYEFSCIDCGSLEIWTAEQQKWWYEVAKGPAARPSGRPMAGPRVARMASVGGRAARSHWGRLRGFRDEALVATIIRVAARSWEITTLGWFIGRENPAAPVWPS